MRTADRSLLAVAGIAGVGRDDEVQLYRGESGDAGVGVEQADERGEAVDELRGGNPPPKGRSRGQPGVST